MSPVLAGAFFTTEQKRGPWVGVGGKEEKKKREKKPTFLFSFFSGGPRVFEAVEEVRG